MEINIWSYGDTTILQAVKRQEMKKDCHAKQANQENDQL